MAIIEQKITAALSAAGVGRLSGRFIRAQNVIDKLVDRKQLTEDQREEAEKIARKWVFGK